MTPAEEVVDDPASYGIDWEVAEDPVLMNHLLQENVQDWEDHNPFSTGPASLSEVTCKPPDCPLSADQILLLDAQLDTRVDMQSRNMHIHRLVWLEAMSLCRAIYEGL